MKRVCLLTGGSGLLGTAFMERYANEYSIVAVYHRNPIWFATQDQAFVDPLYPNENLSLNQHAVHSLHADLSHAADVERVICETVALFGSVDILVNSAVSYGRSSLLAPEALEAAEFLFQVNVLAPLRLAIGLARRVWTSDLEANLARNRNVVNVSSTSGLFVHQDAGLALYGTTKAAVNHLTYHLASEFWDIGIRVNAVAPTTFPALMPTEEVVDWIVRLDGSTTTGQVVRLGPQDMVEGCDSSLVDP